MIHDRFSCSCCGKLREKKNLQTIEIIYIYQKTEYNKKLTKVKQSKIFFFFQGLQCGGIELRFETI